MKVLIKGIKFKVKLLTKEKYMDKYGNKQLAHVEPDSRVIIFRNDHVKKNIVIHEITHAFIASLGLGSCNELTLDDFEEIICEMMEDHLMDINRVSNEVMKFLKGGE